MRSSWGAFLSIFIIFTTFLSVEASAEGLTEQIHQIARKYHSNSAFEGNIQVKLGSEVLYKNRFGLANEAFEVPHSDRSRFMIASVSKQFTAALILKLHDEGVINIHNKYSDYVELDRGHPGTLEKWDAFTIADLLTHTAGTIRDVRFTEYYSREVYAPMLSTIVWDMTSEYDVFPGERDGMGSYSNLGYLFLAYLVQRVTNREFHDVLNTEILLPLGLRSTGQYHRMFNIQYMADGYNYPDGLPGLRKRCCDDTTSFVGSHSLYSDVNDLMVWLQELTAERSKLLSKESREMMLSAQNPLKHTGGLHYGFGMFIDAVQGHQRIWHDGVEPSGYLSLVSAIPELKLKIVILGNHHRSEDIDSGDFYTRKMNDEISELVVRSLSNEVTALEQYKAH